MGLWSTRIPLIGRDETVSPAPTYGAPVFTHEILQKITGATEVAKVDRYEVARPTRAESAFQVQQRTITVDIADYGADADDNRYMATATSTDTDPAIKSVGNPAATIEGAIRNVHWHEFD